MTTLRIAGIQHDIVWESPADNHRRLAPRIANAAAGGARLVVLTEMYATGFSMATDRIAEPEDGPNVRFLVEQAAANDVWVCGSVAVRRDGAAKPANQLVLADPHGTVHRYDKIHPFTFGREHEHYAAGDRHCTVDVDGLAVTLFVCYDLRFADEFWATAPQTDCYVVPGNWPESRRVHWTTLLRARAIENQAYVVGVNRVGEGNHLTYIGDSMIVDPLGEVLASATATETTISAEVSRERVHGVRATFPFLQDRR